MGLRSTLARLLHVSEPPADESAGALRELVRDHDARLSKLELERPAFVAELENLLESCTEILDRAGSQRARNAARESRAKKANEQPELEDPKAFARANPPTWKRGLH